MTKFDLEQLIAQYQKRIIGAATVKDGMDITEAFAEACRTSQPVPTWALVIRAMAARIHLQESRINQLEESAT